MLEERADAGKEEARELAEPFSVTPGLDRVVGNVRILEEWYAATFRRRIAELTEVLSIQIAEQLRGEFDSQCKTQIEGARSQWESANESLKKEVEFLQKGIRLTDGLDEITRIEKKIDEIESELEHSFTADSVPLSRLLQLRTTQTELKCYLRGLNFFLAKSAAETKLQGEPSLQS